MCNTNVICRLPNPICCRQLPPHLLQKMRYLVANSGHRGAVLSPPCNDHPPETLQPAAKCGSPQLHSQVLRFRVSSLLAGPAMSVRRACALRTAPAPKLPARQSSLPSAGRRAARNVWSVVTARGAPSWLRPPHHKHVPHIRPSVPPPCRTEWASVSIDTISESSHSRQHGITDEP
jgi:hypothetical protein